MEVKKPVISYLESSATALQGKSVAFLQGTANFGLTVEEARFLQANSFIRVFRSIYEVRALPAERECFDVILIGKGVRLPATAEAKSTFFEIALSMLVAGGTLQFLHSGSAAETLEGDLLLGGFINASTANANVLSCEKPKYKPALSLPKAKKANNASVEKGEEMIDEDALLNEDCETGAAVDGIANLSVSKRACKNCTCGLKEAQVTLDVTADNALESKEASAPPSNEGSGGCGSCARGDAFRCGGCPYLGTPAFTPGTKPQIIVKEDGSKTLVQIDLGGAEF